MHFREYRAIHSAAGRPGSTLRDGQAGPPR
jgi:hypothetical protein